MKVRTLALVAATAVALTVSPASADDTAHCRRQMCRIRNAGARPGVKVQLEHAVCDDQPSGSGDEDASCGLESPRAREAALPIVRLLLGQVQVG